MVLHAKTGGQWVTITKPSVKVTGTYRDVKEVWQRSGGIWTRYWNAVKVNLLNVESPAAMDSGATITENTPAHIQVVTQWGGAAILVPITLLAPNTVYTFSANVTIVSRAVPSSFVHFGLFNLTKGQYVFNITNSSTTVGTQQPLTATFNSGDAIVPSDVYRILVWHNDGGGGDGVMTFKILKAGFTLT